MHKKITILLSAVLGLVTNIAHATWFVGVNAGVDFVQTSKQVYFPYGTAVQSATHYIGSYTGFRGQLLGGYEFKLSLPATLAIEADIDNFSGNEKYTVNEYLPGVTAQAVEKLRYGFSVFLLPKYHPTPNVALFIGPGFSRTQFEAFSGMNTGGNIGITGTASSWLTGWGFNSFA